jgi:hypothetical protein
MESCRDSTGHGRSSGVVGRDYSVSTQEGEDMSENEAKERPEIEKWAVSIMARDCHTVEMDLMFNRLCQSVAWIKHIEAENAHLKAENESLNQKVINLSTSVAEAQEEHSIQSSLAETLAENERLRQELDNRTNGRWSADQVELTQLRGKQKMMEIALAADKRLRDDRATLMKDLRWLVDYWLANCDSGILGSRCNYTSVQDVSNRLAAMERSESQ